MVYLISFSEFSFDEIVDFVNTIKTYILDLLYFIENLPDTIFVLFPFLSVGQVEYLNYLIFVLIVFGCYFFFKKVV